MEGSKTSFPSAHIIFSYKWRERKDIEVNKYIKLIIQKINSSNNTCEHSLYHQTRKVKLNFVSLLYFSLLCTTLVIKIAKHSVR